MPGVKLAWYGDDFTGATDTLATAAHAGLRSLLFLGVPHEQRLAACGPLDCLGIAGASRSMAPVQMRDELLPVARLFSALEVPVLHYKICSTFDSSPETGSIGTALRTLRPFVANPFVPVVGGQPNLGRYCAFGNLFARAGSDGAVHRLDRHPTMRRHPVTPMQESDLRLHLAHQGLADIASLEYPAYGADACTLDAQLDRLLADAPDAVLLDLSRETELPVIGRLIWQRAQQQRLLAVGPSSVMQALAAYWRSDSPGTHAAPPTAMATLAPARGPVLVLAGSLSPQTAQQVGLAHSYTHVALDPQQLRVPVPADALSKPYAHALANQVSRLLRNGENVLLNTSATAHVASGARTSTSTQDVGDAQSLAIGCGRWLAKLLQATPVARLGIAGGDSSSHAVRALDAWGLSYLRSVSPGVALCRLHSDLAHLDGMEISLKGGQMGRPQVFEQLVHGTASP